MSWLTEWDEARKHPWRTAALSLIPAVAVGVYMYLRENNPWLAAVAGIGVGAVVLVGSLKAMRDPESARRGPSRPFGSELLYGGFGLGLVVVGAALGSWTLVFAGLPLVALAVGWHVIRRRVMQRRATD